mgnify:CR=1 FL=1
MSALKDILHEKRKATEDHIRKLQQEGKEGVRYTAMMPDIPFLVLGLFSDIGWLIHLIAGALYLCRNGFHHVLDYLALLALAGILFGVAYLIYLNKIHEKEIATRRQKDLSFGLTVFAGLAGGMIGIFQIVLYAGAVSELVWMMIGGFLNFASGAPIYFSFKKGIFYGVK